MAIKKKYQGQALGRGLDALLQTEAYARTRTSHDATSTTTACRNSPTAYGR